MPTAPPEEFQADVLRVIPELQRQTGRVLEEVGGSTAELAALCERLGIHRKLAWQVRRFAHCPDPFRAARLLPTPGGLRTFVAAARSAGAEPEVVEAIEAAGRACEQLSARHAGGREGLDLLAEGCASEGDPDFEAEVRRQAFQGNAFIWGVRSRLFLATIVLAPSPSREGWFDCAQVRGLYGLQRMRPGVRWTLNHSVVRDEGLATAPRREPLDPEAAARAGGVPLLGRFTACGAGIERTARGTELYDRIAPGPVGQLGEEQVVTGEVMRELSPTRTDRENRRAFFGTAVRTPTELLVMDQFVHRSLFPGVERRLCVFGELSDQSTTDETDLLPVTASIQSLPAGPRVPGVPEAPRYAELLAHVFDRMGFPQEEFELHRVRIPYPPVPSSVLLRHPVPSSSDAGAAS